MKSILRILALLLIASGRAGAQSPEGPWSGAITIQGVPLNIVVTFARQGDSVTAKIDIPQQMALGLPLRNVHWTPPKVHFELPAGPGLAVFDGAVSGDSVRGDFSQSGIRGGFYLMRGAARGAAPPAKAEDHPVPYIQEEIHFTNGDVTLAGTLTLPPTKGPHPAVIMITGSGPQNRDEELFGFKPFKIIADHLTRRGIAVLRYDDRGVAASTGNFSLATPEDFAGDAIAGFRYLQARADVNRKQIGFCGHSEGGIVAPMAAVRLRDVAFIILMAGPSVTGERIIMYQVENAIRSGGGSESELAAALRLQAQVFSAVHSGTGWDDLEKNLKEEIANGIARMGARERESLDSAEAVNSRARIQLAGAQSPWFKYFAEYDPAPALGRVACPVLALFGELDQQVPLTLNREPMEKALRAGGNSDWYVKVFPKANHLFVAAETGNPSEYPALEKQLVPGFLDFVAEWIARRVTIARR